MKATELTPGIPVSASRDGRGGLGEIIQVKPGNFHGQDYQVQHLNGQKRWYAADEITPEKQQKAAA